MTGGPVRPAAVFSDRMILQRGKPVPVWGEGADGVAVTVRLRGAEACAVVKDGRWRITLPPQEAGEPCKLTVTGGAARFDFADVLFGDVWLAGGQSNMEWPLIEAKDGGKELEGADNPYIRHYNVPKCARGDRLPQAERDAGWRPCPGDGGVSAVAYWFAKEVHARTGVPVGVIGCNWGGTSAAAWMSRERLERMVSGRQYIEDFYAKAGDKPDEQFDSEVAEHDRRWGQWKQASDALREKDPGVAWREIMARCGEPPWPYPVGRLSPFRPNGLYETMLSRVAPYGIKGFIYYQGEEDTSRAGAYFDWMCALIEQWRADFGDDLLPFLFVQLPMYDTSANIEKGWFSEDWPLLREAQARVSRFVKHTGLAVIPDCGELDNVHPADKAPVGRRLALQALEKVYKLDGVTADGPSYKRCECQGNRLCLFFDGAEGGLALRGGDQGAFEVAGADGVFVQAGAVLTRGDTLWVHAATVEEPCAVRYAWRAYSTAPLFGVKSGLPTAPFRGSI